VAAVDQPVAQQEQVVQAVAVTGLILGRPLHLELLILVAVLVVVVLPHHHHSLPVAQEVRV
jgi:hypothetical protein